MKTTTQVDAAKGSPAFCQREIDQNKIRQIYGDFLKLDFNFIKFHPMVTWESHELSLIIHSQGAHARQGLSPGA
jgi:hypothetical protein